MWYFIDFHFITIFLEFQRDISERGYGPVFMIYILILHMSG